LNKFKIDLIFGHMEVDPSMLMFGLAKSLKRILMTQTWQQHVQHLLFRQVLATSLARQVTSPQHGTALGSADLTQM
jgi:hypothetical protein